MRKMSLLYLVLLFSGVCFAQSVANQKVTTALFMFENDYPEYVGKVYLTGGNGDRTW